MNSIQILKNGIIKENPTLVQVLGMCPTLAVTTSGMNGLGMGLSTTVVLTLSNLVISMCRKVIPDKIRIPAFVVIIASLVTILEMFMKAYTNDLYNQLGIYIPLIVVNCIILGRAESFASKNKVYHSALDGLAMGLGFTAVLTVLACIRQILGAGSIFNLALFGQAAKPAIIMILPPGAFLVLGFILAAYNKITAKKGAKA